MKKAIIAIITISFLYAVSWAITIGIIKLITLCFSLNFSLLVATGIWLILCAIRFLFPRKRDT